MHYLSHMLHLIYNMYHVGSLHKMSARQIHLYGRTYLQLPLQQWGAGNIYLLVLSSLKVNIAENLIAVMGL